MKFSAKTKKRIDMILASVNKDTGHMAQYLLKQKSYKPSTLATISRNLNKHKSEINKLYLALRTVVSSKSGLMQATRNSNLDKSLNGVVTMATRIDVLENLIKSLKTSGKKSHRAEDDDDDDSDDNESGSVSADDILKELDVELDIDTDEAPVEPVVEENPYEGEPVVEAKRRRVAEDNMDDDIIDDVVVDDAIDTAINELTSTRRRKSAANVRKSTYKATNVNRNSDSGLFDFK